MKNTPRHQPKPTCIEHIPITSPSSPPRPHPNTPNNCSDTPTQTPQTTSQPQHQEHSSRLASTNPAPTQTPSKLPHCRASEAAAATRARRLASSSRRGRCRCCGNLLSCQQSIMIHLCSSHLPTKTATQDRSIRKEERALITHNFELAPLASGSDPGAFGETSVLISMVQGPSSYESSTLKVWRARAGIRTIG